MLEEATRCNSTRGITKVIPFFFAKNKSPFMEQKFEGGIYMKCNSIFVDYANEAQVNWWNSVASKFVKVVRYNEIAESNTKKTRWSNIHDRRAVGSTYHKDE